MTPVPNLEQDARMVILNEAQVEPPGFFARLRGKTQRERVMVVLTDAHLYFIVQLDEERAFATAYRRAEMDVQDYAASSMAKRMPDHGISFTASGVGASHRSTQFIGLGPGLAAERFRALLLG